jgi:hypothetical protein
MSESLRTPSVDVAFLANWSPARFAALGLALYATLLVVSPLQYDYSVITVEGSLYAAVVLLAFFAGCYIGRAVNAAAAPATPQPVGLSVDRLINLTIAIGAVGVTARLYDRVILRGLTISETYEETRESLAEGVSAFGYIGGLCFSFGIIALALMWLSSSQRRRPATLVLAGFLALYPMLESLLVGSRSTMLHTAFLLFFFARATNALRWVVRSRLALMAGGIALIVFAQLIYEIRSLQGTDEIVDISDVFRLTAIGQYARPPEWITEAILATNGQGLVAAILKNWTHFTQYLTHSWLAYFVNYSQFDGTAGWGRYHLNMPLRALSAILGEDLTYDPSLYGIQLGMSGTAFTAVLCDFGAAGPFFAGLFGFAATAVHRRAIRFPERWLPLHAYLCFGCLTMLIDNQLVGGLGAFATCSFIAYVPLNYFMTVLSREAEGLALGTAAPNVPTSSSEQSSQRTT